MDIIKFDNNCLGSLFELNARFLVKFNKIFKQYKYVFCLTLSEFENFLLCERILINVTTCQNEMSS
jgi:hypothetical protein